MSYKDVSRQFGYHYLVLKRLAEKNRQTDEENLSSTVECHNDYPLAQISTRWNTLEQVAEAVPTVANLQEIHRDGKMYNMRLGP